MDILGAFDTAVNYLRDLNVVSISFRIILSVILSGLIGIERGDHNRPAGFRTHVLVCLGSTIVMITSQYINDFMNSNADPARLGAQVISGIGFLGAGTIIINGAHVKGLTTAAGLWSIACIGIAIGIGFYEGAIIGSIAIYVSLVVFSKISKKIYRHSSRMEIYVELVDSSMMSEVANTLAIQNCEIGNIEFIETPYVNKETSAIIFSIRVPKEQSHANILDAVKNIMNVAYVEEVSV